MKFEFSTLFSSSIRPLVSEEKDKYLSLASLIDVGNFIPNVNAESNMDLLPIAFNACVVNRVNKNGDVVDSAIASEMYKNFINKPINIEHNRANVVGVILSAGFSEFGTDAPLTEEQVKDKKEPYNITLGGVVWKIVNKDLANTIEESNDPTSNNYMKVSASWELGYNDFEVAVLEGSEKNIENATIISDKEEIEKIKGKLTGFGGSGRLNENQLIVNWDPDTIPTNTLFNGVSTRGTVDYIIDPATFNPTAIKITGLRLLILSDIGAVGQVDGADAWKSTGGADLVAQINDIIEWNGTQWNILFDASANSNSEDSTVSFKFVTNLNTGVQYKWNGATWLLSFEGEYRKGTWNLSL